ncbi:response regulator transcription factor [Mucilaginibacter ginkgonis]|uniref:DNA-binding response regulator n=1 Tax=Mucilaginibacter ginkgonis TaxID=2682091 RepID=A0A6I4I0B6_9SPHI|nr:LuxR C-terminal-related transcriptional regulator [Mucilaginibacter ginkgonis]QQL48961.1 DNA-binding response regulator [Mucilaginibacter ginkgonis]
MHWAPVSSVIKNKPAIIYGLSLAILLVLLKWLEFKFVVIDHAEELYSGALAVIFTALGVWLALKLARPKMQTVVVEKAVYLERENKFKPDQREIESLNISKRELEVLTLMAEGLSNQEIAGRLFVSLNTVKTHSSNVFDKLEVKRRTQAVETAKRIGIIG